MKIMIHQNIHQNIIENRIIPKKDHASRRTVFENNVSKSVDIIPRKIQINTTLIRFFAMSFKNFRHQFI